MHITYDGEISLTQQKDSQLEESCAPQITLSVLASPAQLWESKGYRRSVSMVMSIVKRMTVGRTPIGRPSDPWKHVQPRRSHCKGPRMTEQ